MTKFGCQAKFIAMAGFQAGPTFPIIPTFPYFFVLLLFLFFSENALLYLLFSPKMFEVIKNCTFFSLLASLPRSF